MLASLESVSNHKPTDRAVRVPAAGQQQTCPHLLESLASLAVTLRFEPDEDIIFQNADAEYCFEVVSGCIRTVRLLEDGRRQVGEFLFAGDVLGCESAQCHELGAEAVTAATLRRYRLRTVEERAARDPAFAQLLRRHGTRQIRAARGRLLLLGRKTAAERIASFLLEMRGRLRDRSNGVIELPMGRADIADYLGLTIETVCRGLTEFRHAGMIAVDRSRIVILDLGALTRAGSDQIH